MIDMQTFDNWVENENEMCWSCASEPGKLRPTRIAGSNETHNEVLCDECYKVQQRIEREMAKRGGRFDDPSSADGPR
jgi:hypothetical protein